MVSRRVLPLATVVLGALALTGCVVPPPPLSPQASASATTSGSTVTIDGQPVGSWGSTLTCLTLGESALVTSDSAAESGSLVGSLESVGGAWQATGFLLTNGADVYSQTDESVPATLEDGTLTVELGVTGVSGTGTTLAVTAACG